MTTAVFDTLKASRNLKAVGINEAHAEAIVTTMAGAFEDTVATKADVVAIRADVVAIRADIDKLEASTKADLKAEIAGVKADLRIIKYFFGPTIVLLLLKIAFFS